MKSIDLKTTSPAEAAKEASDVLKKGGVILYPTETVYGLGVDPFSSKTLQTLATLKERPIEKMLLVMVNGLSMAEQFGAFSNFAKRYAQEFWPGPLSIVTERSKNCPEAFLAGYESIGFRCPQHDFCREFVKHVGAPITSTSANKSGEETKNSVEEIVETLGEEYLDLVIDVGVLPPSKPSTIINISNSKVEILRDGAIPKEDVLRVFTELEQKEGL